MNIYLSQRCPYIQSIRKKDTLMIEILKEICMD